MHDTIPLITVRFLADHLRQSPSSVAYRLRKQGIAPVASAGRAKIYDAAAFHALARVYGQPRASIRLADVGDA